MALETINLYQTDFGNLVEQYKALDKSKASEMIGFYRKFTKIYSFVQSVYFSIHNQDVPDAVQDFMKSKEIAIPSRAELLQHKKVVLAFTRIVHDFADQIEKDIDPVRQQLGGSLVRAFCEEMKNDEKKSEPPKPPTSNTEPGVSFLKRGFLNPKK